MSQPDFFPVNETAIMMRVGDRIDRSLTQRIAAVVKAVDALALVGVREIIPSYTTILIVYDHKVISDSTIEHALVTTWNAFQTGENTHISTTVVIPVIYGDEFGEDLQDVVSHHRFSSEEVISRHVAGRYTVGALGFSPGFAYLIGLDPALETPRRIRPRTHVPAGSVAIGGAQTGIYPLESPGGWNLIGRTPMTMFDPNRDDPFPLHLGDELQFEQVAARDVDPASFSRQRNSEEDVDGQVEVHAPGLQTTVQDLGRHGFGAFGFAPNGAADRASLIAANRAVGNPDHAAALEITLTGPILVFQRRTTIAVCGANLGALVNGLPLPPGRMQGVMPGDEVRFRGGPGQGARAYLAIAGGIEVPLVMGSRSTDLTAAIGGYHGRALRVGDRLPLGQLRRSSSATPIPATRIDRPATVEVVPGPQADWFPVEAWDLLLTQPFTISPSSNRMGLRLEGPPILPVETVDIISEGVVTGSIQVTGEGQPIVMLPGHATIGGYAKIATVIDADLDRLGQLGPGDILRFTSRYRTN